MLLAALLIQAAAPPQRIYRPPPCHRTEGEGSRKVLVYRGDRTRVNLELPQIYEGVWIDAFESQKFIAGAITRDDVREVADRPWFNTDESLKPFTKPRGRHDMWAGNFYKVRFIGRQAVDMHRVGLRGYGHMNASPGLVVLDEMLSIEPLDAPE